MKNLLPNMISSTQGIETTRPLYWRSWDQVVVDLWHVRGERHGGGHYLSPNPRIVVFLDNSAEALQISSCSDFNNVGEGFSAFFIPADLPVWSRILTTSDFQHLDIHFSSAGLQQRLQASGMAVDQGKPRFLALA